MSGYGPFEKGPFGDDGGFSHLMGMTGRAKSPKAPEASDFLDSDLTLELFDRTPEQRHETVTLLNQAREARKDMSVRSQNELLFGHFVAAVSQLVAERVEAGVGTQIDANAPAVDVAALQTAAEVSVQAELAELNAVLPLPALQRLTSGAQA